ncbi:MULTISPECIES: LPD7 domain-containing protein [Agrobacterium]|uniref:Large polyvalent protein-associated domain-containing protein n=1 Tax=Agrobacterium larrymoorei TaxID=160699 RepID=A0ABX8TI42_9HYPH|nr:LPD7 domain-containing protein [Agrobacterium larrymoorei]NSZ10063.1 hypothetical protein [Agrobacterium tumefaciens]QYA10865.1 hypothetical protein J5285_25910 [Agrobacterium larrymoorei]
MANDNMQPVADDADREAEKEALLKKASDFLLEVSRDLEKEIAAPSKSVSEKAEREPGANEPAQADPAAKSVKTELGDFPEDISRRYYRKKDFAGDDHVYADAKGSREIFQSSGDKLRTKTDDPQAIKLMLDTAAHRGWSEVKVSGTEDFKREAWLEGQARGINVTGYRPNEMDLQELKKREQLHLKNEIAPQFEQDASKPSTAASTDGNKEIPTDEPFEKSRADRSSPDYKTGIEGTVIDQGARPYRDNPKNDPSPFVVLRDANGRDHTAWGVGLPDAMMKAGARNGDQVRLQETGMERVTKTVIRTVDGNPVRVEQEVDRRSWDAEVTKEREQIAQEIGDKDQSDDQGIGREQRINAAEAKVSASIVAGEKALHTGPGRDPALEDGMFANEARAKEYAASGRAAGSDPELRSAATMEAYVERKLRQKFHNDPMAVQRGMNTARNKITQAISRGQDFPQPRVVENREVSRGDDRERESVGAEAERAGKQGDQREQNHEQDRDMDRESARQQMKDQTRQR